MVRVRILTALRSLSPVQRYLWTAGYTGRGPFANAEIVWSESRIRMEPDREWLELRTHQFDSVPDPIRVANMRARRLFGLLPSRGRRPAHSTSMMPATSSVRLSTRRSA